MGERRARILAAAALALAATIVLRAPAAQDAGEERLPILFTADEVAYDRPNATVVASGNVEASYGDRVLLADRLSYDQRSNVLTVTGNIALLEPTGEVLFADRMELEGNLESGLIENVRALLSDDARFAAVGARRTGGNFTEMRKAVYSPCFLCPEDPTRPPLWQIKAVKVVHDQAAKRIEYSDAWFELAGVPVLYTPFLSHPDPTVKRKSGFLVPSIGNSSDLGFMTFVPYYWVIDENRDATITPAYLSNEGPWAGLEYRHAMTDGTLRFDGSLTEDSNDDVRGHVFSSLRYDLDETWRMGLDFNRTTDDTYLRRYDISDTESLTSQAFVEGFRGRNYLRAEGLAFQDLRDVQFEEEPVVLPLVNYYYVGEPDRFGGRWALDLDAEVLTREGGPDSRRLSARAGWEIPFRDTLGGLYSLTAALWADGYQVGSQPIPGEPTTFTGVTGRILPQAALQWRFPLVRDGESFDHVVQPIVEIVVAPNGGNPSEIPNEDSRDVALTTTNLFGIDRFPGLDRVESGTRINYGLQWQVFDERGAGASIFVGQVYRFATSSEFTAASGLERHFSDIVGGVQMVFRPWFVLNYRTLYDQEDLRFERNELSFSTGVEAVRLSGSYVFFGAPTIGDLEGREELELGVNAQLSRYWRGRGFWIRDLADEGSTLEWGVGLAYEDECVVVDGSWRRQNFRDRDLEPSDSFFVRLALKTIGDVGFGF